MKVFGVDPGTRRTGYGCVQSDGSRHRLIACGTIAVPREASLPDRLLAIHDGLAALLAAHRPDCVVVEDLFHARNVRSALVLGHARGVALLAATRAGVPVVGYTPAEVKQAIVGYGRAEKRQVQGMVRLLLGLAAPPSPHDVADALAVAICHLHHRHPAAAGERGDRPSRGTRAPRSWRRYRPGAGNAR